MWHIMVIEYTPTGSLKINRVGFFTLFRKKIPRNIICSACVAHVHHGYSMFNVTTGPMSGLCVDKDKLKNLVMRTTVKRADVVFNLLKNNSNWELPVYKMCCKFYVYVDTSKFIMTCMYLNVYRLEYVTVWSAACC